MKKNESIILTTYNSFDNLPLSLLRYLQSTGVNLFLFQLQVISFLLYQYFICIKCNKGLSYSFVLFLFFFERNAVFIFKLMVRISGSSDFQIVLDSQCNFSCTVHVIHSAIIIFG